MEQDTPKEVSSPTSPTSSNITPTSNAAPPLKTPKPAKKKVLLMGKSGSGKTSMRSIIFSNTVASDVRRLGATIDVEHSQIKFLGNLILNLWDCGGQDAFTETYLTSQRKSVFGDVGVLIYVFDIESRSLMHAPPGSGRGGNRQAGEGGGEGGEGRGGVGEGPDLVTYANVIAALEQYSPQAHLFVLLHKMDLILPDARDALIKDRAKSIRERSGRWGRTVSTTSSHGEERGGGGGGGGGGGALAVYGTSIWDQSLYEAWGDIVRKLIPDLEVLRRGLAKVGEGVRAEECVLFERATFLTVVRVVGERGARNPYDDRYVCLSSSPAHPLKSKEGSWRSFEPHACPSAESPSTASAPLSTSHLVS